MAFPAQIKSPVLQKVLTLLFKVPGKASPLFGSPKRTMELTDDASAGVRRAAARCVT